MKLLILCLFVYLTPAPPTRMVGTGCSKAFNVGATMMGAKAVMQPTADYFKVVEKTAGSCGTASTTEFKLGSSYCVVLASVPGKYLMSVSTGATFASGDSACANRQAVQDSKNNQEFTVPSGFTGASLKVLAGTSTGYGVAVKIAEVMMTKSGGGTVTPVNCAGTWGTCTNDFTYSKCEQTYKITQEKAGIGTDCPATDGEKKACTDGGCSIDCKTTYSACSLTGDKCEKTVSTVTAAIGKGKACASNLSGSKVTCPAGSCGAAVAVTYSGYVVDQLCWDRCNAFGKPYGDKCAPDKARLLTNPEEHTVHCMIDMPPCKDSGFVMLEAGSNGMYTAKYTFDAATNAKFIAWMSTFAEGPDRLRKKVFMKATGTVKGMVLTATTLEAVAAPTKTSGVTAFSLMAFLLLALFN